MKREDHISKLSEIPKKDVLNPPAGYMDSLDERILAKIDGQGQSTGKGFVWYGAVAAAVALIFSLSMLLKEGEMASPEELLAEVSDTDIAHYLEYSDLSVYEIMDELGTLEIETEESVLPELDLSDEELEMIMNKYDISG